MLYRLLTHAALSPLGDEILGPECPERSAQCAPPVVVCKDMTQMGSRELGAPSKYLGHRTACFQEAAQKLHSFCTRVETVE
jgi:hypothetical protein